VDEIRFMLHLGEWLPDGYVFLCPLENLREQASSPFNLSTDQAYWCVDPSGASKFSLEDTASRGFPPPELELQVDVRIWKEGRVYRALRQFHQAKGFDPESQGVATHLGYPLYHVSTQRDTPFAQVDGEGGDTPTQSMREHDPSEDDLLTLSKFAAVSVASFGILLALSGLVLEA